MAWLEGWNYRKSATLSRASGAVSDYQMKLNLKRWEQWTDYASNPIIIPSQSWEGDNIYALSVVTDAYGNAIKDGGNFRGYWGGTDSHEAPPANYDQIGTGTSSDGLSWSKYGSNPLIGYSVNYQAWNAVLNNDPCVIKVGSTYYMWFTGDAVVGEDQIGLASASNPEGSWTLYTSNPVIPYQYDSGEYWVSEPTVIYEDNTYRMWYTGFNSTHTVAGIYYATSSDGITWTRHGLVNAGTVSAVVKRFDSQTLIMASRMSHVEIYISTDGESWTEIDPAAFEYDPVKSPYGGVTPDLIRNDDGGWNLYYGQVTTADYATNKIGVAISGDVESNASLGLLCQADFDDLRFTAEDGTLLDYWIESSVANQSLIVFTEFDSVGTSATSFYMYVGKSDAAAVSSGDDTFLLFDDFPGSSLDSDKWTTVQGAVTVSGGYLVLTGTTGTRGLIEQNTANYAANLYGVAVRTRWYGSDTTPQNMHVCSLRQAGSFDDRAGVASDGTANRMISSTVNEGVATTNNNESQDVANLHIWDVLWKSGSAEFLKDGTSVIEHTTNIPDDSMVVFFYEGNADGDIAYIDYICLRQWLDPEPAWGSWGVWEEAFIPRHGFVSFQNIGIV